ncbi:MAG TPA: ABC transporter transmembrane domain-containing protein [Marmoricola sp.]|nr:ABC transporter transmembrane domain-containing protein [Marmoricola sp.]
MTTGPSQPSAAPQTEGGRGPLDVRALPHLRVAQGWLLAVVAGSTLQGIAAIAQAFALGALIVDLIAGRPQWQVAAGWLLAIALVRALGGLASDYAAAQAAGRISSRLRGLVIRAALNQGYDETARRRAGELGLLATRGVSAVEPYVTRYLPALVVAAVQFVRCLCRPKRMTT